MSIKLIAASRRRPGLTRAEYQRYIEFYHGTISRGTARGKIDKYIQNHVIDGAFGTLNDSGYGDMIANRDGVVELYFKNFRDMMATLEPAEPSEASDDGKFFADEANSITVMAEDEEIPVANPLPQFNPGLGIVQGVGACKVMFFIMRDKDIFPEDFHDTWRKAHEYALEKAPYCQEQLRRCVASRRCRINDNDAAARAHFKMVNPPRYDLVVSMYFDTMEQVGAFRQYFDAITKYDKKFADWSQSFFLYVKQINVVNDADPIKE